MDAGRAIERLQELVPDSATSDDELLQIDALALREQIRAVVARSLGEDHKLTQKIAKATASSGKSSNSLTRWAHLRNLRDLAELGRVAIYELGLQQDEAALLDVSSFDPELWEYVRGIVERGEWPKVAAQVAIFVEAKVRTWGGSDRGLVGKGLYASVLGDKGALSMGAPGSEREGWRALGMGLAQAVGNVDRHHIQDRADARRYAVGVLGLGSLLLTQLRYEHPDATA